MFVPSILIAFSDGNAIRVEGETKNFIVSPRKFPSELRGLPLLKRIGLIQNYVSAIHKYLITHSFQGV